MKTIVNVHIPKTAGSTFRRQMYRILSKHPEGEGITGVDGVENRGGDYFGELRDEARDALANLRPGLLHFVTGHYRYRDIADLIEPIRERVILTTIVRDPVERTLSDYFYSMSDAHSGHAWFREQFPDFASYIASPGQMNKQLEYLRPSAGASVEETLASVRENFDFVGQTERFDQDLIAFTGQLGLECPPPTRVNKGPNEAAVAEAREAHGTALRGALADDIALHEGILAWLDEGRTDIPTARLEPTPTSEEPEMHDDDNLHQQIAAMAPWHHRIALRDGIFTETANRRDATGSTVTVSDPAAVFEQYAGPALPDGMEGKSFLDCGCNAGGYCFAAKDAGADRTFGFDVRQHWIDQARFVAANRARPCEGMRFEVADLLDLSGMEDEFDVTWFSGLFYHLPDPVAGLKIVADRTRELIFVNTAVKRTEPGEVEQPALHMKREGTAQVMSGVHEMSWLPAGSETMRRLLVWMGFPETRLLFWRRGSERSRETRNGRLMIVGAREPGRLDAIRNARPIAAPGYRTG